MLKIFSLLIALFVFSSVSRQGISSKKTILAVFAHPDDETPVDPLLSNLAGKGNDVYVVIATNGEKGVRDFAKIPAGDSLTHVRSREAACVCEALGIHHPVLLGMGDGTLDQDFTGLPLHLKLDSVFRLYQPDIVITWGPEGGYGHMDHRLVHDIVSELFQSGGIPSAGALYYSGLPAENLKTLPHFKSQMAAAFQLTWKPVLKKYLTVRIKYDPADWEKANTALRCHRSQFSEDEMRDLKIFLESNHDTVYLRPYVSKDPVQYRLF